MLLAFLQCRSVGALALCLLCANRVAAQRSREVLPNRIDSIVIAHQAKHRVPAVSLHIGSPSGVTLYAKAYGDARVVPPTAVNARTSIYLGSVSKPYASVVIHRLSEQGLIDLAMPIGGYLTELPPWRDRVTVRQLLSHSSGIMDFTNVSGWNDTVAAAPFIGRALDAPLLFAPGTRMLYSNTNHALVQRLVERVTGRPFGEVLDDVVLRPLGLTETTRDCRANAPAHLAQGYRTGAGNIPRPVPPPLDDHYPAAVAGLCATASDVARFFSAILAGRLLNAASVAELHNAIPQEANGVSSGAGLFVSNETTGELWHHGGAIPAGFNNEVAVWPKDSLLVVVLSNSLDGEAERLTRDIARSILGIVSPTPLDLSISQDALVQYVGRFVTPDGRMIVSVVDRRLHLWGNPCSYQGNDVFVCDPDQARTVHFIRDRADVREAWLLVEGTRRIVGVRSP